MALSKPATGTAIQPSPQAALARQSFEQFLAASADMMDAMGESVAAAGRLEKTTGVSLQEMSKAFMSVDLTEFLKKLGPDLAMLFVSISLRLGSVQKVDLDKLSPDEKISFGAQWKILAGDIRKLVEGLRAAMGP